MDCIGKVAEPFEPFSALTSSHHELKVVKNDVLDIIDIYCIIHGINDNIDISGSKKFEKIHRHLGKLISDYIEITHVLLEVNGGKLG